MEEIWCPIAGYPMYIVSNFGNIYSNKTDKVLKPSKDKWGYLHINLYNHGVKNHTVHRLVATFLGEGEVDHIDRDKTNNHVSNLRLCSRSENQRNCAKFKNCSSRFRGVNFQKSKNKWMTRCCLNGKSKYIGLFETEEEAGRAYDTFCKENNLSTAVLNFKNNIIYE